MGRNSHGTRVRDIMATDVLTVGPATRLRAAMQLMTEQRLRQIAGKYGSDKIAADFVQITTHAK